MLINSIVIIVILIHHFLLYPPIILFSILIEYIITFESFRNKIIKLIKVYWLELTISFFRFYLQKELKIIVHKNFLKSRKTLIISNHVSNFDWILLMRVFYYFKRYNNLVIILKESLRKIPIAGRGMKIFGYIFLKRNKSDDTGVIKNNMCKLKERDAYNILLFPEGTINCENTHNKSHNYALRNNLDFNPERVLLPHKTGYNLIMKELNTKLDGIVDITILYEPKVKYIHDSLSLKNIFIRKNVKPKFFFFIDFLEKNDLMMKEDYLLEVFKRKNGLLEKYYASKEDFFRFMKNDRNLSNDYVFISISFKTIFSDFISLVMVFNCIYFMVYMFK